MLNILQMKKAPRKYPLIEFRPLGATDDRLRSLARKKGFGISAIIRICVDKALPDLEKNI